MKTKSIAVCVLVVVLAIGCSALVFPGDYQAQSAQDKFHAIGQKLLQTEGTQGKWPSAFEMLKLFVESMTPTIAHSSDVMPAGRTKLIHSVGVIAGVTFEFLPNHPYTGLFESGATHAFARMSAAKKPDPSSKSFTPGAAFKMMRSNVHSANFMAMRALEPQEEWNFFKHPFTNHVSGENLDFSLKMLVKKFSSVSEWPSHVGLSDIASYNEEGEKVPEGKIKFPHQLLLVPSKDLQTRFPDSYQADFSDQLTSIEPKTLLYEIYAAPEPNAPFDKIGQVTTLTKFIKSSYADKTLFFEHQPFEADLSYRQDWLNICPTMGSCKVCPIDEKCPMAYHPPSKNF